jgi:hypothetical protein
MRPLDQNSMLLKFPKDFFKKYAKGKPCMIRIAGMYRLQCGSEETTSLCHFTMAGYKAIGSRAASLPDLAGAWGCNVCHDLVDGRRPVPISVEGDQLQLWHAEGVMRTLDALVKEGVLPNP